MPDALREEANSFRRQHSGKAIGKYWVDSCQRKGLYDAHGMILYSPDGSIPTVTTQPPPAAARPPKKKSDTAKPKAKKEERIRLGKHVATRTRTKRGIDVRKRFARYKPTLPEGFAIDDLIFFSKTIPPQ